MKSLFVLALILSASRVDASHLYVTSTWLCEGPPEWTQEWEYLVEGHQVPLFRALDQRYGSESQAINARGGRLTATFDEVERVVVLRFNGEGVPHYGVSKPEVGALRIEIYGLEAGEWLLKVQDSVIGTTNSFTVLPSPVIDLRIAAVQPDSVTLEWEGVDYVNYRINGTADLKNGPRRGLSSVEGKIGTVQKTFPLTGAAEFFYVRHLPISRDLSQYYNVIWT